MSQTVRVFLLRFVALIRCGRRSTSPCWMRSKTSPDAVSQQLNKTAHASQGYRSDESTDDSDPSACSPDGSDTETSVIEGLTAKLPPLALRPPPGLELCSVLAGQNESGAIGEATCVHNELMNCIRKVAASSRVKGVSRLPNLAKSGPSKDELPLSPQKIPNDFGAKGATAGVHSKSKVVASTNPNVTLHSIVRKLAQIEAKRIVVIKKIDKLGWSSSELLKRHFSKCGIVTDVLVSHQVERPAATGFVVMERIEDAVHVFEEGLVQIINGASVSLTAYDYQFAEDFGAKSSKHNIAQPLGNMTRARCGQFPFLPEQSTLRGNLHKLDAIDAGRIITVKKIKKLGLGSPQLLKTHFSQYGVVENVLVAHSCCRKPKDHPLAKPTVRPSEFGFVVMERTEDAVAAFQHGLEQSVYGASFLLGAFQHNSPRKD